MNIGKTLDDKLRALITVAKMSKAVEGHNYELDEDNMVAAIHKAFKDAGYMTPEQIEETQLRVNGLVGAAERDSGVSSE